MSVTTLITVLLIGDLGLLCCAETTLQESLIAGIDGITANLNEHRATCEPETIIGNVEKTLATYERIIEAQWEMIATIRQGVENATSKTQEMVDYYYKASPTQAPSPCSIPFKLSPGGNCFWLHKLPDLTFDDARLRCQQEGDADLAAHVDLQDVIDFLQNEHGRDWVEIFLGAKMGSYGNWHWMDSTESMSQDRKFWHDSSSASGNCVIMNGGRGYKLTPGDCDTTTWFLCQRKLN